MDDAPETLEKQVLALSKSNENLKLEVSKLHEEIREIKQKHEEEITMIRIDFEESQTQLHEMIDQVARHVLELGANAQSRQELKLFSPPRKRHPRSSPAHKR